VSLMAWVLIVCRVVLGATFLVAGLAKLTNSKAAAKAVAEFGAPAFARPILRGLPHLETAVAVALAFAAVAWYAAWVGAALLVVFIAAIAVNLARGRRPDCNCFGQIRPAPISGVTILRNGALLALAGWLILAGPPPPTADTLVWITGLDTHGRQVLAMVGLGLTIALRVFLAQDTEPEPAVSEPVREREQRAPARTTSVVPVQATASTAAARPTNTDRQLTGNGLPLGAAAPTFALPDLSGEVRTLEQLRATGKPVVLIFSSPNCESCQVLVPRLPAQVAAHRDQLTIALVSRDTVERNLTKLKEPGDLSVLRQRNYEVAEDYDVTTSPAAIVVGPDGYITSELAMGGQAILQLITDTAAATQASDSLTELDAPG
jgi:peroxiredoxin/uncharacterized membrane protein YphA (DoxX/SURF4 family)